MTEPEHRANIIHVSDVVSAEELARFRRALRRIPTWDELQYHLLHCDECHCHHERPARGCGCECHGPDIDALPWEAWVDEP